MVRGLVRLECVVLGLILGMGLTGAVAAGVVVVGGGLVAVGIVVAMVRVVVVLACVVVGVGALTWWQWGVERDGYCYWACRSYGA